MIPRAEEYAPGGRMERFAMRIASNEVSGLFEHRAPGRRNRRVALFGADRSLPCLEPLEDRVLLSTVFDNGLVNDVNVTLPGDVTINDSATGDPTTLNLLANGVVGNSLYANGNSRLNMRAARSTWT